MLERVSRASLYRDSLFSILVIISVTVFYAFLDTSIVLGDARTGGAEAPRVSSSDSTRTNHHSIPLTVVTDAIEKRTRRDKITIIF